MKKFRGRSPAGSGPPQQAADIVARASGRYRPNPRGFGYRPAQPDIVTPMARGGTNERPLGHPGASEATAPEQRELPKRERSDRADRRGYTHHRMLIEQPRLLARP